jgi:cardiolipin synthase
MFEFLPHSLLAVLLHILILLVAIPTVLFTKKDSTPAVAWCLLVIFMPFFGALAFWTFGYNYLHRRVRKQRQERLQSLAGHPPLREEAQRGVSHPNIPDNTWRQIGRTALAVKAFPVSPGNRLTLYAETEVAFEALLKAIREATHHIHLEYFILHSDGTGEQFLEALTERAKAGVEVRLLYDAMGSLHLDDRRLRPLREAGGEARAFLPVNPLRSLIQINLRNHRKITVLDGRVGFTGGMNIGDEYLSKNAYFGYWRDTFLRLEGPATAGLQRIFVEDWDFTTRNAVISPEYFPDVAAAGTDTVQVIESGPDQTINSIREMYFAAILSAQERVWIATPYFVPDAGLLDALRLARYRSIDVRLLCILRPDHFLSFHASRYYWTDMLNIGVKIYQYAKGMMHSKLMMVDGQWAMVGSANLDNRSLHLNFEVGCMLHTPDRVAELEKSYLQDLRDSVVLEANLFARRPLLTRLTENACRLFSPVL